MPNFQSINRYWFYIEICNNTDNSQWILHLSNFFIDEVNVVLVNADGGSEQQYYSNFSNGLLHEKINTLGRGFDLYLDKGEIYTLAIELSANSPIAPPYIGLMTTEHYSKWSLKIGSFYKVAIGIIFGIILIGFICSFLLKDITFLWFSISSFLLLVFYLYRSSVGLELFAYSYQFVPWLWIQVSFTLITILLFARSFLHIYSPSDRLYKLFQTAIFMSWFVLVSSLVMPKFVNIALYSLNAAVMFSLIVYSGVLKVIQEGRYYLIYMLGWMFVLFPIFELILVVIGYPQRQFTELSYKVLLEPYMQILHMLLHMIAMFIRVQDLKRQKLEADIANRAKSEFLSSISHDFRQPLHSMGMFLSLLQEHISSDKGKEIFFKAQNSYT